MIVGAYVSKLLVHGMFIIYARNGLQEWMTSSLWWVIFNKEAMIFVISHLRKCMYDLRGVYTCQLVALTLVNTLYLTDFVVSFPQPACWCWFSEFFIWFALIGWEDSQVMLKRLFSCPSSGNCVQFKFVLFLFL